jgi:hypothetical protein
MNIYTYLGLPETKHNIPLHGNNGLLYAYKNLLINLNTNTIHKKLKPLRFIKNKNYPPGNKYIPVNSLIKQLNLNTNTLVITQNQKVKYYEHITPNYHQIEILHHDENNILTYILDHIQTIHLTPIPNTEYINTSFLKHGEKKGYKILQETQQIIKQCKQSEDYFKNQIPRSF